MHVICFCSPVVSITSLRRNYLKNLDACINSAFVLPFDGLIINLWKASNDGFLILSALHIPHCAHVNAPNSDPWLISLIHDPGVKTVIVVTWPLIGQSPHCHGLSFAQTDSCHRRQKGESKERLAQFIF